MDTSLVALTEALKKIVHGLQPAKQPLSFILLIGKTGQGKTTLLRHNTHQHTAVNAEQTAELYYNAKGIILELDESWLNQSTSLLQHTLKQLNQCHRALKITGLLITIDINELITHNPKDLAQQTQPHAQLLQRFGRALGYTIDTAFMLTKLDSLAGFCDFFQHDKRLDQDQALGFSVDWGQKKGIIANNYHARFDHLLESLHQDMLQKIHPVRSSLKRSLIREFPLQLAKFHLAIETLIKQISPKHCRVCAIYFTSAKQGGISADHLNQKICQEYDLALPTVIPQSSNYRAYFINGALDAFQAQTQRRAPRLAIAQKHVIRVASCFIGVSLAWIVHHHVASSRVLDNVTKELLAYERLNHQRDGQNEALLHLSKAAEALEAIKLGSLSPPSLQHLQTRLNASSSEHVTDGFLPYVLATIERALRDPEQSVAARYHTLKIYITLGDPSKRVPTEIIQWFQKHWKTKATSQDNLSQLTLLKKTLLTPNKSLQINQQLVRDTRTYLNALPVGYLYYSLLKKTFPTDKTALAWEGFQIKPTHIPVYFTKQGFQQNNLKLSQAAMQFQHDNWVLEREDLNNLPLLLEQAYAYDYATWWKQFLKHVAPQHVQNYTEGQHLLAAFDQGDTLRELAHFIQAQTSPDLDQQDTVFNQTVASQFTELNLISEAALHDLALDVRELRQFISTLAALHDNGHTAFTLTKKHFQNKGPRNALSTLYTNAKQLPEPIASWAEQLADDAWFLLLNDTKTFVNLQWQQHILPEYQRAISNRYPINPHAKEDIALDDFNHFFASHGVLNTFAERYIKPFLNTSTPDWERQEADGHVLPINPQIIQQLIHANVITAMFFSKEHEQGHINFSLKKLNLDPIIAGLELSLGNQRMRDTQTTNSITNFTWPASDTHLILHSIEGQAYKLAEQGPWALFKLLQKFNILLDKQDGSKLHVLLEINGNSGRYLLKADSALNPFTPGVLADFKLEDAVV